MRARPYILWIEFKRFYAEPCPQPVIILREQIVLDANDAALARGIQCGISQRQARAILHGGIFKLWQADEFEERRRAWLDLCVDFTGVIEPADQHCAWLDLSLHPNPVDVAERLIRVLAQATGLAVAYGAAPSKWIARLAAKYEDCGLAERDPRAFLAALPVHELLPIAPEHRDRLRFLGYDTIGGVAGLPLPVLQEQFGQEGLIIHSAATGQMSQQVKAFYPPSSMADSIVFDGIVDDLETVQDACRSLALRIGERLANRNMQSGKLRIALELEDGSLKALSRTFTKPLRCPGSVHSALRLLVGPALKEPVVSIRAFIPDLERVREFQPGLVDGCAYLGSPEVEAAMRNIRTVFGDKSIQLGKEIDLPRRVKVLREWKHATGWR
ncbi:MAG TPA: hypothetical protein VHE55_12140 [Fimbriimonadaceae bacterium]|nr:hypothetical protein [Fimbriimonadaceae bacterium]